VQNERASLFLGQISYLEAHTVALCKTEFVLLQRGIFFIAFKMRESPGLAKNSRCDGRAAYQNPGQISDLIKSEFGYFSLRGNTGMYSRDFAICNVRKWKLLQRSFQQAVARPSGTKTRTVMFPATKNRLFFTCVRGFFSKSGDQFEKIHDQIDKFASHFSRKAVGLFIGPNTFELAPKIFAC